MNREQFDDTIHEIHCRDAYLMDRVRQKFLLRPVYEDLPEAEVIAALYGDYAPADLTSCIVMRVHEWTVPVPLGAHEADKWERVCEAIDNMISAADDPASSE